MTTEKTLTEVLERADAHHRLHCALEGRPYVAPADRPRVEGIAARLAAALGGAATRDPLPEAVARRVSDIVSEASRGGRALPDDVHERLARALTR